LFSPLPDYVTTQLIGLGQSSPGIRTGDSSDRPYKCRTRAIAVLSINQVSSQPVNKVRNKAVNEASKQSSVQLFKISSVQLNQVVCNSIAIKMVGFECKSIIKYTLLRRRWPNIKLLAILSRS
jgi:hypothetical protein